MMSIFEPFKELHMSLNEQDFNLSSQEDIDELHRFIEDEDNTEDVEIYVSEDEKETAASDYIGKVAVKCEICGTLQIMNEDELEQDPDSDLYNIDTQCIHCRNKGGFELIGRISELNPGTENEDSDQQSEEELADDDEIHSNEESDDIEESLNEGTHIEHVYDADFGDEYDVEWTDEEEEHVKQLSKDAWDSEKNQSIKEAKNNKKCKNSDCEESDQKKECKDCRQDDDLEEGLNFHVETSDGEQISASEDENSVNINVQKSNEGEEFYDQPDLELPEDNTDVELTLEPYEDEDQSNISQEDELLDKQEPSEQESGEEAENELVDDKEQSEEEEEEADEEENERSAHESLHTESKLPLTEASDLEKFEIVWSDKEGNDLWSTTVSRYKSAVKKAQGVLPPKCKDAVMVQMFDEDNNVRFEKSLNKDGVWETTVDEPLDIDHKPTIANCMYSDLASNAEGNEAGFKSLLRCPGRKEKNTFTVAGNESDVEDSVPQIGRQETSITVTCDSNNKNKIEWANKVADFYGIKPEVSENKRTNKTSLTFKFPKSYNTMDFDEWKNQKNESYTYAKDELDEKSFERKMGRRFGRCVECKKSDNKLVVTSDLNNHVMLESLIDKNNKLVYRCFKDGTSKVLRAERKNNTIYFI